MSLACPIGPEANILEPSPKQCHRIFLENPIISLTDLEVCGWGGRGCRRREFEGKNIYCLY